MDAAPGTGFRVSLFKILFQVNLNHLDFPSFAIVAAPAGFRVPFPDWFQGRTGRGAPFR